MSAPPPPADSQAIYAGLWHAFARAFRIAAVVVAVLAGMGAVSALLEGAWPFTVISGAFIGFVVAVRRFYDTEPVYASREGIHLLRDKAWKTVPWPRVGKPKPFFGLDGPVVVLLMDVEGERRPVRFIARREHREALERLRPAPSVALAE